MRVPLFHNMDGKQICGFIWVSIGFVLLSPPPCHAKDCPPLIPPAQGVLRCEILYQELRCQASCYDGSVFDTGEAVVSRSCDQEKGEWREGNFLPVCLTLKAKAASVHLKFEKSDQESESSEELSAQPDSEEIVAEYECNRSLLTGNYPILSDVTIKASSDVLADVASLYQRAVLGAGPEGSHWRPGVDDISQFLEVDLQVESRIEGVVIRGDMDGNYVTAFRVLFSIDGKRWYPYTDGEVQDVFLRGNTDSVSEFKQTFSCPHEARFVKINPIGWNGHVALAFDLIGCTLTNRDRKCKPLKPPSGGVINCEVDGTQTICTAYCLRDQVFEGAGPVLTRACDDRTGLYDGPDFPRCVAPDSTQAPYVNITGYCMGTELDCFKAHNGDYQYCGDCHYFSTCNHEYLYVRACPAMLQFDANRRQCEYKSDTCTSKNRRAWLRESSLNHRRVTDWYSPRRDLF